VVDYVTLGGYVSGTNPKWVGGGGTSSAAIIIKSSGGVTTAASDRLPRGVSLPPLSASI